MSEKEDNYVITSKNSNKIFIISSIIFIPAIIFLITFVYARTHLSVKTINKPQGNTSVPANIVDRKNGTYAYQITVDSDGPMQSKKNLETGEKIIVYQGVLNEIDIEKQSILLTYAGISKKVNISDNVRVIKAKKIDALNLESIQEFPEINEPITAKEALNLEFVKIGVEKSYTENISPPSLTVFE